jgi:hypothetical protein
MGTAWSNDNGNIHTHGRNDMDNAMNELWRAQQNAATRAAEGWLGLLQPGANRAPQTPAPPAAADEQAQAPTDSDTIPEDTTPEVTIDLATPEVTGRDPAPLQAIEAIQNLGNGQRDFAEHMARWAELQRDLADSMTAWASQQREYADALDRLLAPFSPRA